MNETQACSSETVSNSVWFHRNNRSRGKYEILLGSELDNNAGICQTRDICW